MFHPHRRAFWQPVADGFIASLVFGIAGGLIADVTGMRVMAGVGLLVFFFYSFFYWRTILRLSYEPSQATSTIVEPGEDWPVYRTLSSDFKTWKIIEKLPVPVEDLTYFARGMVSNPPVKPTYDAWSSVFDQPSFSEFRLWLVQNHFAELVKNNEIEITAWGQLFFQDVFERGIEPHSPAPAMTLRRLDRLE